MSLSDFTPDPNDPLDQAWVDLSRSFGFRGSSGSSSSSSGMMMTQISQSTIHTLQKEGLVGKACSIVQAHINMVLREEIAPSFWRSFLTRKDGGAGGEEGDAIDPDLFHRAVSDLFSRISGLMPTVRQLEALAATSPAALEGGVPDKARCRIMFGQASYVDLFKLMIKGTLHSQLPLDFEPVVHAFYSRAFHVFYIRQERGLSSADQDNDDDNGSSSQEMLDCAGCKRESERCGCDAIIAAFDDVNRKLSDMDLLERLTSGVVEDIVHSRIDLHVLETCKGSFTISHLQELENWLDAVVMSWVQQMQRLEEEGEHQFRKRLRNSLYETYTKTRIEQLFNIIIEFPDSQPALEDLKECLVKTSDLRGHLTRSLKLVLQRKLLHLGVNTTDILTAYIAAIRALRVLDPSGVVLDIVCEPVRKYLRTRDDTVRCIVQSLIDDNNSELSDELRQNEGLFLDESFYEEDDMEGWETWTPDPVDANSNRRCQSRRTSDIISMLVNIYGSKELFVNEYRSLLSNRLLSQFSYDADREIRNLELLKLRFGEAPLHQCEVMLKDIGDSKRINGHLHSSATVVAAAAAGEGGKQPQPTAKVPFSTSNLSSSSAASSSLALRNQPFPVNAVILSAQFWPQFKEENLQLPPEVTRSLEVYTKAFEAMKGNRTLVWKNHLGFANIDLEIGDKKINLTVSPVHAAIICQFQAKAEWTADELAHTLKIPVSTLRRRIAFWQTQGLVREMACDRFVLIEDCPMRRLSGLGYGLGGEIPGLLEDDESESVTRSAVDQREDELQVFWTYIVNMLINLESLPLERIFQMLKMFAVQAPSGSSSGGGGGGGGAGGGGGGSGVDRCDLDEVRQFLDRKVREHELVFVGGQYKLPPKN